jgi:hypothetical protein
MHNSTTIYFTFTVLQYFSLFLLTNYFITKKFHVFLLLPKDLAYKFQQMLNNNTI